MKISPFRFLSVSSGFAQEKQKCLNNTLSEYNILLQLTYVQLFKQTLENTEGPIN